MDISSFRNWIVMCFCITFSCAASAQEDVMKVGSNSIEIQLGDVTRTYVAQVPNSYTSAEPVPLLVLLHGTGGTPQQMLALGHFYKDVELNGYIAVAPKSLGRAFNDGSGRGGPDVAAIDDVAFIEAVVSDVRKKANIDAKQIYLAGFSSGASMAQRFAAESTSDISAVFAPGGHFWIPERLPARPRSVLLMWGTKDKLNPIEGGEIPYRKSGITLNKPAVAATAAAWAKRLGCSVGPTSSSPWPGVAKSMWSGCLEGAVVELYIVDGLGHHWGGGRPVAFADKWIGPYSDRVTATELMWSFFKSRGN